jgi:hypothetical protein
MALQYTHDYRMKKYVYIGMINQIFKNQFSPIYNIFN